MPAVESVAAGAGPAKVVARRRAARAWRIIGEG